MKRDPPDDKNRARQPSKLFHPGSFSIESFVSLTNNHRKIGNGGNCIIKSRNNTSNNYSVGFIFVQNSDKENVNYLNTPSNRLIRKVWRVGRIHLRACVLGAARLQQQTLF